VPGNPNPVPIFLPPLSDLLEGDISITQGAAAEMTTVENSGRFAWHRKANTPWNAAAAPRIFTDSATAVATPPLLR
jgi:hypothetical protein